KGTGFPLNILVSGNVPEGETLDVEVRIVHLSSDGSDISPADTIIIPIEKGDYDGKKPFPVPLDVLPDEVQENREQFRLEIVDKPGTGGYRVGSVTTCGDTGKMAMTYTILDAHASIEKTGTFVDLVGGTAADGSPIK